MKLRSLLPFAVLPGLLVLGTGCASSAEDGPRRDTTVLTAEEMADAGVTNLYEAVERLRPRWLQVRTRRSLAMEPEVSVFHNRIYVGPAEQLRTMGLTGVARLRYMDGPLAAANLRLPTGVAVEGAILVETGGGG